MNDTASDPRLLATCPHCGATNRVPAARIDDHPVCGRCAKPLLDGQVLALGDADFDAVVMATDRPLLVDFWAAWCGPCRMMAPAFAQAAQQLGDGALLVKVDTDANPLLARRFAIRSIPTLVKIVQGREVARTSGAQPAGAIVQMARG
jgi:thioredoxin 2